MAGMQAVSLGFASFRFQSYSNYPTLSMTIPHEGSFNGRELEIYRLSQFRNRFHCVLCDIVDNMNYGGIKFLMSGNM